LGPVRRPAGASTPPADQVLFSPAYDSRRRRDRNRERPALRALRPHSLPFGPHGPLVQAPFGSSPGRSYRRPRLEFFPRQSHHYNLIVKTGVEVFVKSLSVVVPIKCLGTIPYSCVPRIVKSAPISEATVAITSPGEPVSTRRITSESLINSSGVRFRS